MKKIMDTTIKQGRKDDSQKLRWDLLPIECIEDVVKILTFGANKYAPNNWQLVPDAKERYYAALLRHLTSWRKGELVDPESNLPHLAHAMCNMVFLSWFDNNNESLINKMKPYHDSITRSMINISDEQIKWAEEQDRKMLYGNTKTNEKN